MVNERSAPMETSNLQTFLTVTATGKIGRAHV